MRLLPALLLAALLAACTSDEPERAPLAPAMPAAPATTDALRPPAERPDAPALALPTLADTTFTLADHTGGVAVVNFWATWCAPCREETPELAELYRTHRDEGLQVVGISLDSGGFDAVAPFAEEYDVPYAMAWDEGDAAAEAFGGIPGLPVTFLIDREGHIAQRIVGRYQPEVHGPLVEQLLAE